MSEPVYTDLSTVKAYLGVTGTTYDDELTADIAAAARWIDERCNRRFYPDADALQTRKFLPQNPGYCIIDDLLELTALVAQESLWLLDQDFYFEPINAPAQGRPYTAIRTIARPFIFTLAQIPAGWAGFDGRISLTGKFGWAEPPDQIVRANVIQAARYFHRRNAILGVISFPNETAFRMAGADADVVSLVDPFALQVLF
jgi:hypothetical protein